MPACETCRGMLWVCEDHPGKAWPDDCDCGAGMPCECNPTALPAPGSVTTWSLDAGSLSEDEFRKLLAEGEALQSAFLKRSAGARALTRADLDAVCR